MASKRINRVERFCSLVRKKDVLCVLSENDIIQCECAHIVPLNGEYGQSNFKNPELLNDSANGMLLSKELHFLYDQFIWAINPFNYKEIHGTPNKHEYTIEIASNYKNKSISINKYDKILLRAESHNFIEIAYSIFINNWNPTIKKNLVLNKKSLINHNITKNKEDLFITIDKMNENDLDALTHELNEFITNSLDKKKNFSKQIKNDLSEKYNIHHESIHSYYTKLKKNIHTRKN